jgi:flagellar biosynthesis/type III secretory pathway protein FliH
MSDGFDWIDENIPKDFLTDDIDEGFGDEKDEPVIRKSARDFLKRKTEEKVKNEGSPAWRSGYSDGFREGKRVGQEEGFKQGYEKALRDCQLPD